jgi:hypothetical protein
MSFYGTHPAAYASAITALKLGPTMRNTQFPGSDDDMYANPQDMQTCAVPLAHKAFKWNREGDHTFKISGGATSTQFTGMTNPDAPHFLYAQALKQAEQDGGISSVPLYKSDGTPYNVAFPNYTFDTAYETAPKAACDVGVTLAPWGQAQGFEPTQTAARFGYDGACYQPPHCGC